MSSNSEQLLLKATLLHPEAVTYVRCGFLWQAHPALASADWSRRWYSWTDGVLKHCSSPAAAEREVMQPALRGVLVDAQPLSNLELRGMQQLFGFCVQAVTGEAMALYAETEDSRERWLRAINSAGRPMALSDRYNVDFTSPLGSGLCAVVLKATKKHSGEACAVKMIKPETFTSLRHMLNRELFVWSALSFHPHILHLQDVLQSSTRLYFITDLCQGGSLLRHLASRASYSECDAARIVRQVLEALQHMHSCGTVHCDVKPENICMASRAPDAPVKLLDMGMASFVHCPMEPGGTPEFVAPELLQRPEHYAAHGCGPEVDIWSAGVLLYYLLSGRTPFYAATMDGIIARVKTGTWVFKGTCWQDVSEHAKAVVRRMLQVQPSSRPSAAELLKTPWLSGSAPNKPLAAALAAFKAQAGDPQPEPPAPAPVTAPRMPRPASFTQLPADGVAVPQDAAQSMARQRRATYATYDSALDPRLIPMLPQQQQQQPGAAMLAGRSSALPAVAEQHQQLPGLGNFVPQQAAALLESLHVPGAGAPRVFQRSQSHSISSPLVSSSLGQQPYPWDNPNPPLLSSHVLEPITAYTSPRNSNHGLFGGPLDALLWARPTSDSADTSNRTSRTSNSGVQLGLTSDNSQSAAQYKGHGRSVSVDEIGIRKQAQSQPQLHHANPQAVSQQQILMLQEQVMALRLAVAAKHQQEQLNTGGSAMSSQLAATSLAPAMPPAAFSAGLLPAGIAADGTAAGGAGVAVGGPLNGIAKGMLHGTLDLSSIPEQAVMPQGRSSPRKSMSLSAVDMAGTAAHRAGTEQQARWSGACVLGTIADEGEETYFDAVEHPAQPAMVGGSAAATPAPQPDGRSVHALQLQALQQQLLELRAKVQAGKGGTASGVHS